MKTSPLISIKPLVSALVTGVAVWIAPMSVQAAPIIDESFNNPTGTIPTGWTSPGDSAVVDTVTYNGENQLRLTRPSGQSVWNQVLYYNGTGIDNSIPDSKIANFEASVIINTGNLVQRKATTSAIGMVIKGTSLSDYGVSSGSYFIAFSPAADPASSTWSPSLGVWTDLAHNPPSQYADKARNADALTYQVFEPFSMDTDVLLRVTANGTNLTASLWSLDDEGVASVQLASVLLANISPDAGYIGLRAAYGNTGVNTYYRDFQVTAIPEPTTALLIPVAGLTILGAVKANRLLQGH